MFCDEIYNWGRIATVYAFAGHLAKYLIEQLNGDDRDAYNLGIYVGMFVNERLGTWIASNKGWEGFVDHFQSRKNPLTLTERFCEGCGKLFQRLKETPFSWQPLR